MGMSDMLADHPEWREAGSDEFLPDEGVPEYSPATEMSLGRWYADRVRRTELLSAEEEVELAKRIEAGVLAAERLGQLAIEEAVADRQLRLDLRTLARQGEQAKERFITANIGLVSDIARRYANTRVPYQDLMQEGMLGLIRAVEKFDYTRGNKFSTYGSKLIRGAIAGSLPKQGRVLPVSREAHEDLRRLKKTAFEGYASEQRQLTAAELAERTGLSERRVTWLQAIPDDPDSLDRVMPFHDNRTNRTLGDTVGYDDPAIAALLEESEDEDEVLPYESGAHSAREPAAPAIDTYKVYMRQVRQIKQLSREEINVLAEKVQAGRSASMAAEATARGPNGTRPRKVQAVIAEGLQAERRLAETNLRLVVSRAGRLVGRGLPMADLIQEGSLGLMRAIETYDPHGQYTFGTHASTWIDGVIRRAINNQARNVRLPVYMTERLRKINKVMGSLAQDLGRTPTSREIADAVGITPQELNDAQAYAQHKTSIDTMTEFEIGSGWRKDRSEKAGLDPCQAVEYRDMQKGLADIMADLPERERTVLWQLYNGPFERGGGKAKELAAQYGISEARVRQIGYRALKKLRDSGKAEHLRVYLEA